jgi:6-phosphogluconolactonase
MLQKYLLTNIKRALFGCALLLGVMAMISPGVSAHDHDDEDRGAVFALTNSPAGNAVVVFARATDGSLTQAGSHPTGGLGSGAGLGSQDAVIVSEDRRLLFAVNAGSNSISSFHLRDEHLQLLSTAPSGGVLPTSVTYRNGLLYVLNAGEPNNITGFRVTSRGQLVAIDGSTRPLSAASTSPAQVGFSDDGKSLVVTERATNIIDTFTVDDDGRLDGPFINTSAGPTPFGFAVGRQDIVLVSEAGAGGGASTYRIDEGHLDPISAMIMTGQRAACWAILTPNGRFGYVTNAGTGNISGVALARDGSATLLDADGITAVTGGNPTDMAMSADGRYLYARVGALSQIAVFRIQHDGSLFPLQPFTGAPSSLAGLAGF